MFVTDHYHLPLGKWIQSNRFLSNLGVVVLYGALAQYGFILSDATSGVSPLWPPAGLVIACVLLGRRSLLIGIFLGAFTSQLLAGNHIIAAAFISTGVTLSAYVAYSLLLLVAKSRDLLGRSWSLLWVLFASLTAPLISAMFGAIALCFLDQIVPSPDFWSVFRIWWIGDAIGALTIAPAIISLRLVKPTTEWIVKVALLATLCGLTFSVIFLDGEVSTPLLFLAFPITLIGCHWFGATGAAWSTLGFVIFATTSLLVFGQTMGASPVGEHVLLFDLFVFSLAITSITLSIFYRKAYFLFPALLFTIGWMFSGWAYYTLQENAREADNLQFVELADDAAQSVQQRLQVYIDALKASAGYYLNSELMKPREWRDYVSYINIEERYPGINGLGFIRPFKAEQLPAYIEKMHADGIPDFSIKNVPSKQRQAFEDEMGFEHYIITSIEPIDRNVGALGLDIATEIRRRTAAQTARDSGQPVMTDRITLVQDGKSRPGFLVYLPIYTPQMPIETVAQRRAAFIGWSYAPFISEDFLSGIFGKHSYRIEISAYDDAEISPETLVYRAHENRSPLHQANEFDYITRVVLADQTFSFGWNRGAGFLAQQTYAATIAAASLALGTCLLVGIVVNLQGTNRRVNLLVKRKTTEVRKTNNALHQEVQERKKAQAEADDAKRAAESANYAKSEFLATMSHEIRTPMNSVIGFSELLASSELDQEQKLWTDYIRTSGDSLLRIINDILDISKIEAGKLTLEQVPLAFDSLVSKVVGSFTTIAAEKGIAIDYKSEDTVPNFLLGDPIRIRQIITNLLANALKFTSHGCINLDVGWENNEGNEQLTIKVADTGIGIPKDKLQHLFDKFMQVDSSTTRRFGGTGLGLAICKNLTDLMGGQIEVESSVDVGTTILVTLPLQKLGNGASDEGHTNTPIPYLTNKDSIDPNAPDVLLVDDNRVNQQLGLTFLKRLGCTVALARDGKQTVDHVMQTSPSIIFLDCQMPVMDGYEATKQIRKLERSGIIAPPKYGDKIIIIALTANATNEDRDLCLEVGMDDYMRKPCGIKDFKAMLETYWTARRAT
jgi:signal transduction histidine kinase/integral membrane sensor domain MASE1/ActR/RegA family two-component response regulator